MVTNPMDEEPLVRQGIKPGALKKIVDREVTAATEQVQDPFFRSIIARGAANRARRRISYIARYETAGRGHS